MGRKSFVVTAGKIKNRVKTFKDDQRGIVRETVGIIVVLAVLMMCVLVYAPLQEQAQEQVASLNNSEATSAFNSIAQAGWGALNMFGIVPYIVVAITIIGSLLRLFT